MSEIPEGDLVEITERIIKVTQQNPNDETRYIACRWLRRLFYDVRKWNWEFISFLRTYPGFNSSTNQREYWLFFQELAKRKNSLDSRYGEAKGDLCANLKMLAARFTLDFRWLYQTDESKYNALYSLVHSAYSSEDSILEAATTVIFDVIAKDNIRYSSDLEKELDDTQFLSWHLANFPTVIQTILSYEKGTGEAVEHLNQIAEDAGFKFLTIQEYQAGLSDPLKHPEIMSMGEQIITERKTMTSTKLSHETQRLNTVLAFTFGVIFIATILALVVFIPNPTAVQYHFFAIVMALAAGGFGTVLTGMVNVKVTLGKRLAIGATGALGVFVIVYFFLPAMTAAPQVQTPASSGHIDAPTHH